MSFSNHHRHAVRAILTFHSVDEKDEVLSFSPESFEHLLFTLSRKGIPVLRLDQLLADDCREGVALTFDDGMKSVVSNALPVMLRYRVTGMVYIAAGLIGTRQLWPSGGNAGQYSMMDWDDVSTLIDAGIQIGAHTDTHPDLRTLDHGQINHECTQSDQKIFNHTGVRPKHFAYPFGYHSRVARSVVANRYLTAVSTELAFLGPGKVNCAALPRVDSYFLRSPRLLNHLDSHWARLWLASRSRVRTLAGRQCTAQCV